MQAVKIATRSEIPDDRPVAAPATVPKSPTKFHSSFRGCWARLPISSCHFVAGSD